MLPITYKISVEPIYNNITTHVLAILNDLWTLPDEKYECEQTDLTDVPRSYLINSFLQ